MLQSDVKFVELLAKIRAGCCPQDKLAQLLRVRVGSPPGAAAALRLQLATSLPRLGAHVLCCAALDSCRCGTAIPSAAWPVPARADVPAPASG